MEPTTNTGKHAKAEMEALAKHTPDHVLKGMEEEIVALADAFGRSGQSGGSYGYVAEALSIIVKTTCMQEPVTPLTGEDDEWGDISEMAGEPMLQNKRCTSLFKKGDIVTCVEAVVFVADNHAFSGNVEGISSVQAVKSFPFVPKTFHIPVITEEVKIILADDKNFYERKDGTRYRHKIKDWDDLVPVFQYYDQLEVK